VNIDRERVRKNFNEDLDMRKEPEYEGDSSLPSSDEVNNVYNSTSTSTAWCLFRVTLPLYISCHVTYGVELRSMEAV
jgi:hypothetical protein